MNGTTTITGLTAALLLAVPALAGDEGCANVENGGFDDGLRGWTVAPTEESAGDAGASADAQVGDGANFGPQFSGPVAVLSASAGAGANNAVGDAFGQIVVSRTAVVTDRFIQVIQGGGFEFLFFGNGSRGIEAFLRVEGPGGAEGEVALGGQAIEGGFGCGGGLSILGTFLAEPPHAIDLQSIGIDPGDEITVSIVLRANAATFAGCQSVEAFGLLVIDDVAFCEDGPVAGDVTGDGIVNVDDLVAVILAWGPCGKQNPLCLEDVNGDFVIDVEDLIAVILFWT